MKKLRLLLPLFLACSLVACGEQKTETPTVTPTVTPSEGEKTDVPPEEPRVIYDYEFNDPADVNQNAYGTPGEGDGIVVKEGGYATTISNGDFEEGPARNWTFAYEGYDRNIESFEMEAMVKVIPYDGCTKQAGVCFRFMYDWGLDCQFQFPLKKGGDSGLYIYNTNGSELARRSFQGCVANTWTKLTIRLQRNADQQSTHVTAFVNDVCGFEMMDAPWIVNNMANQGIGCSEKAYVQWDYVKLTTYVGPNTENGIVAPTFVKEEPTPTPTEQEMTPQEKSLALESMVKENVINRQMNGADLQGQQAFNTGDNEGKGIVVNGAGQATTVDDDGNEGVTSGWSFNYSGYDNDIPAMEIETKVQAVSAGVTQDTQVAALRIFYDRNIDMHVSFGHQGKGWSGIVAYGSGSLSGTLFSVQSDLLTEDAYHVVIIKIVPNIDMKTSRVVILIDNTTVMDEKTLEFTLSKSSKFGVGASAGSYIKYDYYKVNRLIPHTGTRGGTNLINEKFDGEPTHANAFGTAEEGKGLFFNETGYITTVDNDLNSGVAESWTYSYGSYDLDIPNFRFWADVTAIKDASAADTETASFRFAYDDMWDFQFAIANKEGAYSGLNVYRGNNVYSQPLSLVAGVKYRIEIMQFMNYDLATSQIICLVDGIVVMNVVDNAPVISGSSKLGIGCSQGSWLNWDNIMLKRLSAHTDLKFQSSTALKYEFTADRAGQQAFDTTDCEGKGIVVGSDGYATTVTNDGNEGASASWCFNYLTLGTAIDGAVQAKVVWQASSQGSNGNCAFRIFFGGNMFDFHNVAKVNENSGSGLYCYFGGQVFGVDGNIAPDVDHTTTVRIIPTEGTVCNLQVLVDGVTFYNGSIDVGQLGVTKVAVGSSDNTYAKFKSFTIGNLA